MRVLTWNLQGSNGFDLDAAAAVIGDAAPDVVLLQEVQRRQCHRLAEACRFSSARWAFKHWPVVAPAEGLAVLSPHPLTTSTAFVVRWWFPWSWKRRVALEATVAIDGRPARVLDVHLSPHDAVDRRIDEVARLRARRGVVAPVIGGDLNERPGGPAPAELSATGWVDAWEAVHGADAGGSRPDHDAGATNWTAGDRTDRLPSQRIDAIFVPDEWRVVSCTVVAEPLAVLAGLSDHLPLIADVEWHPASADPEGP